MSGVKGRSGGPRANAGGARPGAGRKPKPPPEPEISQKRDPLEFLLDAMQGLIEPTPTQLRAAVAATQYLHAKKEAGKKDDAAKRAETLGAGKFGAATPPKLAAANGKRI